MSENTNKIIATILAGIGGGIVMTILIILMMMVTGFTVYGLPFALEIIAAAAMPLCLNIFSNKGIILAAAQLLMIAVSDGLCVVYATVIIPVEGLAVANAGILLITIILHSAALAAVLVSAIARIIIRIKQG